MNAIEMRSVRKVYGDVVALDGFDLSVPAGAITALLGPNGAGKSTAFEVLLGLRIPDGGQVEVLGHRPDDAAIRPAIGAMLQDPGFPEATTCAELLGLVGAAYPDPISVDEALAAADLTGLGGRRLSALSGGQRQRVAFAVALVGDPDLLVLDEPTVALDVQSRLRFWTHARRQVDAGRTVLFSTHHLAEAEAVADHVIVVDRGRVVVQGTPAELTAAVAARTVRLTSPWSEAHLADLPGVERVRMPKDQTVGARQHPADGRVTLHVSDTGAVLAALVAGGHDLSDVTVAEADLEDAFLHLTASA